MLGARCVIEQAEPDNPCTCTDPAVRLLRRNRQGARKYGKQGEEIPCVIRCACHTAREIGKHLHRHRRHLVSEVALSVLHPCGLDPAARIVYTATVNVDNGFVVEMPEPNLLEPQDREFTVVVRPPLAVILWLAPRPTIELSRRAFVRLFAHPRFQPHFGVVSDWRRATGDAAPHFDRDFLAALHTFQTNGRLRGRWATVVPASAHMIDLYRAGRTIEMMGRPGGLRYDVFVNYEEAVEWASNRERAREQWLSLDTQPADPDIAIATSDGDPVRTTASHLRALLRKR